jgi:hypothetical protein
MSDEGKELDGIVEVTERTIEERIRDFGDLLTSIDSLDDNKRKLWKEIYENSISDRQNSYAMFTRLVRIVSDKSTEHAVHGKTVATYIERMQKANDQLIKLAELIARAQGGSDSIDPEDMFSQIQGNKGR